jgi:hypothetical protein
MCDSINTIGFIFNKSKTIIKCDKKKKYYTNCCANNYCINNLYKICIFKLEEEHFMSSTLNITTDNENAWEAFKNNVGNLLDAFFIISVTKCNKLHSFNAKFIKYKRCDCCNAILLYFKFNIIPFNLNITACSNCIPITCNSNVPITSNIIENYWPSEDIQDNIKPSYNNMANFAYKDLKSSIYTDVKFYCSDKYASTLCFKPICYNNSC